MEPKKLCKDGRPIPPAAGMGRIKGSKNKLPLSVKMMIIDALEKSGGMEYLARQAEANPPAFMSLVGKVLPLQITGEDGGPVLAVIERHIIK